MLLLFCAELGSFCELIRRKKHNGQPGTAPIREETLHPITRAALEIIERDFASSELNLNSLSKRLKRHPRYVSALFKKDKGVRLTEYLNEIRLKKAWALLETTDKSVFDIGLEAGYGSYEYFAKIFKKKYKVTPSSMRKK